MERDLEVLIRILNRLRRTKTGKKKIETTSYEETCCSYEAGYIQQNVFLCKTCKIEAGICTGCFMNCHKGHCVVELGIKKNFRCDCGLGKKKCTLNPNKSSNNNVYNHNFHGRFCLCDREDSDLRDSEMHVCVGCLDWFHLDCIQVYNNCHNLAPKVFHDKNIPIIPKDTANYFFLCEECVNRNLYIPSFYKDFISLESLQNYETPHKNSQISRYPYHIFVMKSWIEKRCKCSICTSLEIPDLIPIIPKKFMEESADEEFIYEELPTTSHEEEIFIARGINIIREMLMNALQQDFPLSLHLELLDFKKRVRDYQTRRFL
jgi:hypothetical protein